jgi:hypothetical protein
MKVKGDRAMKKTFRIEYWEHSSTTIDVEAETEEEALEKAKEMVECGEVDCSHMELGDCGYEPMGEVNDED